MSKYIDAEKCKLAMSYYGFRAPDMTITEFIEDECPAADVAEVVRCKDCKHFRFSDMYGECSQAHVRLVKPDGFCSYGERKEEK